MVHIPGIGPRSTITLTYFYFFSSNMHKPLLKFIYNPYNPFFHTKIGFLKTFISDNFLILHVLKGNYFQRKHSAKVCLSLHVLYIIFLSIPFMLVN